MSTKFAGQRADSQPVNISGPAAMKAYFEAVRQTNPDGVLLLDAGDHYQGSLVSNTSRGQAMASLYNYIGVDASTIGNHEFDWGGILSTSKENQKDYDSPFLKVVENSKHPFLAHNISFRNQPLNQINGLKDSKGNPYQLHDESGESKLASYAMFERNGVKVAVVGGITKTATASSSIKHYRGVKIKPIGKGLGKLILDLKSNQGAQIVVLLTHAGASCSFANFDYKSDKNNTSDQCPGDKTTDEIRGIFHQITKEEHIPPRDLIDVVVAGHVHAPQAHYYEGVPVIQNIDKGLGFSRVDITFDRVKNVVTKRKIFSPELFCHTHFENYPGCNPNGPKMNKPFPSKMGKQISPVYMGNVVNIKAEENSAKIALKQFEPLFSKNDKFVTNLPTALVNNRFTESIMGRCYVDAIQKASNADLVFATSGGIRESLPKGKINVGNIFEVAPFDGNAVEVSMKGKDLKAYISQRNQDFTSKSMPIVSDGWKLKVNCEGPEKSVTEEETYRVVVSGYLFEKPFFNKFRSTNSKEIKLERDLLTIGLNQNPKPVSCDNPIGARPEAPQIKRCDDTHPGSRWCGINTKCPPISQ